MPETKTERQKASFLENAAKLLAQRSPSTSAFLGTQVIETLVTAGTQLSRKLSDCCHGCGALMVPGWTSAVASSRYLNQRASRPQSKAAIAKPRASLHRCLRCNRAAKVIKTQSSRPRRSSKKPMEPIALSSRELQPILEPITCASKIEEKSEAKTNSKKRAKARKDREGLQALLSQSRTNTQPNSTFDLMDFMKP